MATTRTSSSRSAASTRSSPRRRCRSRRRKRIQIDLINESYARIRGEGYFAVTTNTVQFGTRAEYFFGFSALSVTGHSSFDALIQFSPFHFTVSISTSFSVKVFGVGVYGIDIDLTLEGPTPWHAHGTASISFFFFSIGVEIDFTWGDDRETTLPPVAVMPILSGELEQAEQLARAYCRAARTCSSRCGSSIAAEAQLVLHPVGTLQVSQRAVPLDLALDKVGSQKPSDANRFSLAVTSADLVKTRDLQEPFAPAQFKDFERRRQAARSRPTRPQDSGIELSAAGPRTPPPRRSRASSATTSRSSTRSCAAVKQAVLRLPGRPVRPLPRGRERDAVRRLGVHRSADAPVRGARVRSRRDIRRRAASDNTVFQAEAAAFTSQAAAGDYLARAVAADPTLAGTLHVLPHFEVAA